MSYLNLSNKNILNDINRRKEFAWLDIDKTQTEDIIPRFLLDDAIKKSGNLQLTSYQQFTRNFLNPITPYKRLLLKWQTGSGKSIGALSIAIKFIETFKTISTEENPVGNVIVLGFSSNIFKNELFRFPEFGFISRSEKATLNKLKMLALNGSNIEMNNYHDMLRKLRRRLNNRQGNGYFSFYGYKSFLNKIFITSPTVNINDEDEDSIIELINKGKITYNKELLKQFENSLIICDEIHNVYNSSKKNNWGVAIQYVLDNVKSARVVFTSATPINNNPGEIVDLINLLTEGTKLRREDLFNGKKLLPKALSTIKQKLVGKISYVRDVNPQYYPSTEIIGDKIPGIDYLSFIRSPMSKLQYNTYKKDFDNHLSYNSIYIMDFIIENPDSTSYGIYKTENVKKLLTNASSAWKTKYGFTYKNNSITGRALEYNNLKKYSPKYATMLEHIKGVIADDRGKIFIYHNTVHMSGVLFIEQVLLKNGIIGYNDDSSDNTLCLVCGDIKKNHKLDKVFRGGAVGSGSVADGSVADGSVADGSVADGSVAVGSVATAIGVGGRFEWHYHNNVILDIEQTKEHFTIKSADIHKDKNFINNSDFSNSFIKMIKRLSKVKDIHFTLHKSYMVIINLMKTIKCSMAITNYDDTHYYITISQGNSSGVKTSDKLDMVYDDVAMTGFKAHKEKSFFSMPEIFNFQGGANKHVHNFIPVRYAMVNSEVSKSKIGQILEKYNSEKNTYGDNIMILLGSSLMKESHDIKSIRNVFIMSRPDNIPTLLQIRGRAVRKGSHIHLPKDKQNVQIKIFTTCLPDNSLSSTKANDKGKGKAKGKGYGISYEEEKYGEKIKDFKIIQEIERNMHEDSIDGYINRRSNLKDIEKGTLDILSYKPTIDKIGKITTTTFNQFYKNEEVDNIKIMIKRSFIEITSVWEHNKLLKFVKEDPRNYVNNDTKLFDDNSFTIAIRQLLWDDKTTIIGNSNSQQYDIIDKIFSSNNKILTINDIDYVIREIAGYYVLCRYNDNVPLFDLEGANRVLTQNKTIDITINIDSMIKSGVIGNSFDEKKIIFMEKVSNLSIEDMNNIVTTYDNKFHSTLLEECIMYVYDLRVGKIKKPSKLHEFYFKMLYYYDLLSLVVWVYTVKDDIYDKVVRTLKSANIKYVDELVEETVVLDKAKGKDKTKDKGKAAKGKAAKGKAAKATITSTRKAIETKKTNATLSALDKQLSIINSTINKSSNVWMRQEFREGYERILKKSLIIENDPVVDLSNLPIGHYLEKFPRIFIDNMWIDDPITEKKSFIENDIIIGYDIKADNGVFMRFKIRNPKHKSIKKSDNRLVETGTVCKSKSKDYLLDLAKKLDVDNLGKRNVIEICKAIRIRLIRMELTERKKQSNVKYFYFHYETN